MSSKLVDPEPVQNTPRIYLQQQTPKMKHGRTSVDQEKKKVLQGVQVDQEQTPLRKDARDDM